MPHPEPSGLANRGSATLPRLLRTTLGPFVGLLLIVALFLVYQQCFAPDGSRFLTSFRLTLIAKQTAIVGMGALGMTVIIIAGGIDLSAGSTLALCAVMLAVALKQQLPAPAALALALTTGVAAGLLNGLLVTSLRLVPFIVTLGTMLVFRGLAEQISEQKKIQAPTPDWLGTLLDSPPPESWQIVCTGVWMVLLLGAFLALGLRFSVFGRHVFAIGSNEATARLCGIQVSRVKVAVYALGGAFMALAGVLDFNDLNRQGSPTSGLGLELDMIAAVVIGGGSLNGGRGSILGSILGALTMTTLRSGCVYAGVSDPAQKIVIGSIIIAAVAVDQFLHRGDRA